MRHEDYSNTPLLSVIVPVYGVADHLSQCLASLLQLQGPQIEVIAVNDASPDHSQEILAAEADRDPRLKVVSLAQNVGLGSARNAGIEHATGKYLWFVDGDDWVDSDVVPQLLARLSAGSPDVLIVDHTMVFPDGRSVPQRSADLIGEVPGLTSLEQVSQLLRLAHSACTKVVRKDFLDATGLRFREGLYEDAAFSHPLLMAASTIDVLGQAAYFYRQLNPGGITSTVSARHFEVFGQYEYVFSWMSSDENRYGRFRAELFRAMINHYLVIAGNEHRLPSGMRRAFFRRIAADCGRFWPGWYDRPHGASGIKHLLARWNLYSVYAAMRAAYRLTNGRSAQGIQRLPSQRAGEPLHQVPRSAPR